MGYNHAKAQREFYEEWRKKTAPLQESRNVNGADSGNL